MSDGIQIRLHFNPPQAEGDGEPTARVNNPLPDVLPMANGNEHGSVFFNLDWQNQQAEVLRQQVNYFLYNNNPLPNNTGNDNLPETLTETARDTAEQMRRQTETTAREARRAVEHRRAEIETKKQTATQSDSSPRENRAPTTQTYSPLRGEQTASTAHDQPGESKTVREQINQNHTQNLPTANNANPSEKPPSALSAAPETSGKNILIAENPSSKIVPANPHAALPQSEPATRDANGFLPKPANGNPLFSETATRVFHQSNSETVANNVLRHENGALIGGALINGSAALEDYPQLENIQIGGFASSGNFYDQTENLFAAGALGALMSATVGSVVPSANGAVGGVLGLVSGIVSGTEIESALGWLASDKADAANNFPAAKLDTAARENLDPQLGYA